MSETNRYSSVALLGLLIEARRALILVPLAAAVLAVGLLLLRGREWVADATLRPQTEESGLSQFAGLASQFGLNLPGMSDGESIEFYARLAESRGLLEEIAQHEFRFATKPGSRDTLRGTPVELFEIEEETRAETIRRTVDELRDVVGVHIDDGAGVFSIVTQTKWAGFSEALNRELIDAIARFNVETRRTRARAEREFAEEQAEEARAALAAAEDALTQFMERNRRFQDPALSVEEDRLRRQITIRQQVYTALVQSFEQARLEEVRSTPTITVIDAPEGSADRRGSLIQTALVAAMLGLTLVLVYLFLREYVREQKRAHPGDVQDLRSRFGRRGARTGAAIVAMMLLPPAGSAQDVAPPPFASATLSSAHWAVCAALRLDALGLVDSPIDRGMRTMSARRVGVAIAEAVAAAPAGSSAAELALAYRARFTEEFGPVDARIRAEGDVTAGHVSLGLGWQHRDGGLALAGAPTFPPYPVHDDLATRDRAQVLGLAAFMPGKHVALAGSRSLDPVAGVIERFEVTGRAGPMEGWLGQQTPGYGPGKGGGIVLDGTVPLLGGGVRLAQPSPFPGFLRVLGRGSFDTFLTRLERNSDVRHPWLWGMRASLQPHERVGLGVNRVAMFGGEGNGQLDLQNFLYLLIGKHGSGGSTFDNQVVAVDGWWRLPLGLPLTLYAEWGFEDSAGAFKDIPGILFGTEVAALPGVPHASAGVEVAYFDASCCGSPPWYRHIRFHDGWTVDDQPLGHPLGGHGRELRIHGGIDALDARVRMVLAGFTREREFENIQAPNREGGSLGMEGELSWRVTRHVEAELIAYVENGDDWTETHFGAGARAVF